MWTLTRPTAVEVRAEVRRLRGRLSHAAVDGRLPCWACGRDRPYWKYAGSVLMPPEPHPGVIRSQCYVCLCCLDDLVGEANEGKS